jgi:hypothetical protein
VALMALNFPNSPIPGQTFTDQGRTFTWNGTVWLLNPQDFPWATSAEALAGTRADRAMSPVLTRQRVDQIPLAGTVHPFAGTPMNMLSIRAQDVAYQNNTGRSLVVSVWGNTSIAVDIGSTEAGLFRIARTANIIAGNPAYLFGLVPPAWWYMFTINGGASFGGWTEYR